MTAIAPAAGNHPAPDHAARMASRHKSLVKIFGQRFADTFSSPILFLDNQELSCPVAIRFFHKDFAYLSKALYLEYQYRSWKGYNQELLGRYAELVGKKLDNIKILLTNNVSRMRNLLSQQGYALETTLWPKTIETDVPIIASLARSYWDMLRLLEEVYFLAASANMFGVFTSAQRAEAEFLCKKAIRAFRSILQTEVVKLYREADRLIKEQHSTGHVDKAMAEIVAEQGRDIAQFDQDSDEDARHDPSMDLGTMDAGQLIDDAAAASTAATAKKASKPRKAAAAVAEGGDDGAQASTTSASPAAAVDPAPAG